MIHHAVEVIVENTGSFHCVVAHIDEHFHVGLRTKVTLQEAILIIR